jgi:hypothetical protein
MWCASAVSRHRHFQRLDALLPLGGQRNGEGARGGLYSLRLLRNSALQAHNTARQRIIRRLSPVTKFPRRDGVRFSSRPRVVNASALLDGLPDVCLRPCPSNRQSPA